jgi:hypothetical protein
MKWLTLFACGMLIGCGDKSDGSTTGSGGPSSCQHPIYVDPPCRVASYCSDSSTIQKCNAASCEKMTGTSCCMGEHCMGAGAQENCPAGMSCFNPASSGYHREARCFADLEAADAAGADYVPWSASADAGPGCL